MLLELRTYSCKPKPQTAVTKTMNSSSLVRLKKYNKKLKSASKLSIRTTVTIITRKTHLTVLNNALKKLLLETVFEAQSNNSSLHARIRVKIFKTLINYVLIVKLKRNTILQTSCGCSRESERRFHK